VPKQVANRVAKIHNSTKQVYVELNGIKQVANAVAKIRDKDKQVETEGGTQWTQFWIWISSAVPVQCGFTFSSGFGSAQKFWFNTGFVRQKAEAYV